MSRWCGGRADRASRTARGCRPAGSSPLPGGRSPAGCEDRPLRRTTRPAFRPDTWAYFALRATVKWSMRSPVSAMPDTVRVVCRPRGAGVTSTRRNE